MKLSPSGSKYLSIFLLISMLIVYGTATMIILEKGTEPGSGFLFVANRPEGNIIDEAPINALINRLEKDKCDVVVGPSESVKSVQEGINKAKDGQVVCIKSGTYKETVKINNRNDLIVKPFSDNDKPIIDGDQNLPEANCRQKNQACLNFCYNNGPQPDHKCNKCNKSRGKPGRDADGVCKPAVGTTGGSPCTYPALVTVTKSKNIAVKGMEIKNSSSEGFNAGEITNGVFLDLNVHHAYSNGLIISKSKNVKLAESKVWQTVVRMPLECQIGGNGMHVEKSDGVRVERNSVYNNYGEGMTITRESINTEVINNVLYDNFHLSMYSHQAQNVIIDGNFLFCSDNAPWPFQKRNLGIVVGDEIGGIKKGWAPGSSRKIVNNVIVGCSRSIVFRAQKDEDGKGYTTLNNDIIAHNTVVMSRPQKNLTGLPKLPAAFVMTVPITSSSVFANNLIIQDSKYPSCAGAACKQGGLSNKDNKAYNLGEGAKIINNPRRIRLSNWPSGQGGDSTGYAMFIKDPYKITETHLKPDARLENYLLKESSTVKDSVSPIDSSKTDIYGAKRPVGAKSEPGAYELGNTPARLGPLQFWR